MICTRCGSKQREPRDSLRALIALNVSKTRFQGFCSFLQNEPKTSGRENFVICGRLAFSFVGYLREPTVRARRRKPGYSVGYRLEPMSPQLLVPASASSDGAAAASPGRAVMASPGRQWPEVYDLCHTFLHVARVRKHTDMRESRAILACPCVF